MIQVCHDHQVQGFQNGTIVMLNERIIRNPTLFYVRCDNVQRQLMHSNGGRMDTKRLVGYIFCVSSY